MADPKAPTPPIPDDTGRPNRGSLNREYEQMPLGTMQNDRRSEEIVLKMLNKGATLKQALQAEHQFTTARNMGKAEDAARRALEKGASLSEALQAAEAGTHAGLQMIQKGGSLKDAIETRDRINKDSEGKHYGGSSFEPESALRDRSIRDLLQPLDLSPPTINPTTDAGKVIGHISRPSDTRHLGPSP